MYRLVLDDDLQSHSIDELIDKLGKIKEALETKKACYITGRDVELPEDYNFGWGVVYCSDFDELDRELGIPCCVPLDEDEEYDYLDLDNDDIYDEDEEDF